VDVGVFVGELLGITVAVGVRVGVEVDVGVMVLVLVGVGLDVAVGLAVWEVRLNTNAPPLPLKAVTIKK
jgi:hypothetical protein